VFQRLEPVPICHQLLFFLAGQLKHEYGRESFTVSLHLPVQLLCFYLVKIGNIPIDHHSLTRIRKIFCSMSLNSTSEYSFAMSVSFASLS